MLCLQALGQLASVDYEQFVWPLEFKSGCKGFFKAQCASATAAFLATHATQDVPTRALVGAAVRLSMLVNVMLRGPETIARE